MSNKIKNVSISNAMYDRLKFIIQVVVPAVSVLLIAIADIWSLDGIQADKIVATNSAVALFVAAVLRISSGNYSPEPYVPEGSVTGEILISETDDGKIRWDIRPDDFDPEEGLDDGAQVTFTVKNS